MPFESKVSVDARACTASPEAVLNALCDSTRMEAVTGEPGAFARGPGAKFQLFGGAVRGEVLTARPDGFGVHLKVPYLPETHSGIRVEMFISPKDSGTELRLEHYVIYEGDGGGAMTKNDERVNYALCFKGPPFWNQRLLEPLAASFAPGWKPSPLMSAEPIEGAELLAHLHGARSWTDEVGEPLWWKSTTPDDRQFESWALAFSRFGRVALVRVAIAAARAVLSESETERAKADPLREDTLANLNEACAKPPSEQIDVAERWAFTPTRPRLLDARDAIDASRQLRYFEDDLWEDTLERRWPLAFEAAEACLRAIDDETEILWALLMAREGQSGEDPRARLDTLVTAIAREVGPWARGEGAAPKSGTKRSEPRS